MELTRGQREALTKIVSQLAAAGICLLDALELLAAEFHPSRTGYCVHGAHPNANAPQTLCLGGALRAISELNLSLVTQLGQLAAAGYLTESEETHTGTPVLQVPDVPLPMSIESLRRGLGAARLTGGEA